MKHTKLLLSISLLLLVGSVQGQVFEDGTIQVTKIGERMLHSYPYYIVADSISIDSSKNDTIYYSIERKVLKEFDIQFPIDSFLLKNITLKEVNNRVYGSANNRKDTFVDILMYDFNLKTGDSFIVKDPIREVEHVFFITKLTGDTLLNGDSIYKQISIQRVDYGNDYQFFSIDYISKEIGSVMGFTGFLDRMSRYRGSDDLKTYGESVLLSSCMHDTSMYRRGMGGALE